ncbi:hypothetical protein, variant [Aphanomyces astaci]|uniref:Uncharacterized protein n=1 Tax=Aphanomyces astaci TaxID=112090 RepID=W4GRU8_APHAT|nr:hypothetical protein, variant [Aphanomyces astaci]ETV82427.1 hypothetical protein, variant [Aphanomyces astaci]|eukprot:XP_009828096.1 hypothetical protein, variant [Aphanomyces astaci]
MPGRWRQSMVLLAMSLLAWGGAVSADSCSAYKSGNALADRVDELGSCLAHLGSNLADAIVSHELDYDRKTPLSIVLFANSTELLHRSSEILAATFFGHGSAATDRVFRLDIHEVIQSMASKKAAHAAIHATLVNLVKRCPRRNMLVLENLHLVPQAWLPVLDVFLLPLSGKVATTKDDSTQETTSGLLDTLPTVFVFLFETHTSPIAADGQHWKEYLDGKWQFPGVEFTPQALIGRLGHGMVVTRTSAPTCVVLLAPETIRSSNSVAAAVLISVTVVAVLIAWWVARSRRSHGAKHTPPVVHTPRVCDQRFDDEDEVTFIPHTSHDTRRDVTATTTSSRSCIESVSADSDRVSHDTHAQPRADTTPPSPVSVAAPSVSHAHNIASHVTASHPTPPSAKSRRKKPTLAPVRSISK